MGFENAGCLYLGVTETFWVLVKGFNSSYHKRDLS